MTLESKGNPPIEFTTNEELVPLSQIAGHGGLYALQSDPQVCYKTINLDCLRGRREVLLYQMVSEIIAKPEDAKDKYKWTDFGSMIVAKKRKCDCLVDLKVIRALSNLLPQFMGLKRVRHSDDDLSSDLESIYSESSCKCYVACRRDLSTDLNAPRNSCSHETPKATVLLGMENLLAHCKEPCIMDLKIGGTTYDPMATKEKILEQSSKYRWQNVFCFRVLGIKAGPISVGDKFGKEISDDKSMIEAFDCFLEAVRKQRRGVMVGRILERLDEMRKWFEEINIAQLKFYSSSILLVYDGHKNQTDEEQEKSIRVVLIDFAHVFHQHASMQDRDTNFIEGLSKVREYFGILDHKYKQPM